MDVQDDFEIVLMARDVFELGGRVSTLFWWMVTSFLTLLAAMHRYMKRQPAWSTRRSVDGTVDKKKTCFRKRVSRTMLYCLE